MTGVGKAPTVRALREKDLSCKGWQSGQTKGASEGVRLARERISQTRPPSVGQSLKPATLNIANSLICDSIQVIGGACV